MKNFEIGNHKTTEWEILASTKRSQAAVMILSEGEREGGTENRHEHSDQWLYVIAGRGRVKAEGKELNVGPGSLVLIEAGERHQVEAVGKEKFMTLNLYSPAAYKG